MAKALQPVVPTHKDPEQKNKNTSADSSADDGANGSTEKEDLQHPEVVAHAKSVSTPPAAPAVPDEIETDITSEDVSEHAPGLYVARGWIRPRCLTQQEVDEIITRLQIDLSNALRRIRSKSQRKPWNEDMVMIEMRMAGIRARGSTKVTLRPCIWIFCGSKWCQKILERDVRALDWLEPHKVYFIRKRGPRLAADEECATTSRGLDQAITGYRSPTEQLSDNHDLDKPGLGAPSFGESISHDSSYEPSSYGFDHHISSPHAGVRGSPKELAESSIYGEYTGDDTASVASSSVPSHGGGGSVQSSPPRPHKAPRSRWVIQDEYTTRRQGYAQPFASLSLEDRGLVASDADATRPIEEPAFMKGDNVMTTERSNNTTLHNLVPIASHAAPAHVGESVSGGNNLVGMQRREETWAPKVRETTADLAIGDLDSRAKHNQIYRLGSSRAKYRDRSITLHRPAEHLIHVRVQGLTSLIGMSCISTTWRDDVELSRSASKVGGAVSITIGGNTSLYGVTAGHGLVHQILIIAPQSADDSSVDGVSDDSDSVSEDEEDPHSLSAEDVFSEDRAAIDSAVDVSDHATWVPIDHGITAEFLGIGLHPNSERKSESDELNFKNTLSGDMALFPIGSFHRLGLKNCYIEPGTLEPKEVTCISENECESSLPVVVLLGPEQTVSGSLQPGKFHFSMRGTAIDARRMRLSRDLAPGSSGSWVVHGDTLYGMIVAVFPGECMALMIPSKRIISDFERLFPGATDISVAMRS